MSSDARFSSSREQAKQREKFTLAQEEKIQENFRASFLLTSTVTATSDELKFLTWNMQKTTHSVAVLEGFMNEKYNMIFLQEIPLILKPDLQGQYGTEGQALLNVIEARGYRIIIGPWYDGEGSPTQSIGQGCASAILLLRGAEGVHAPSIRTQSGGEGATRSCAVGAIFANIRGSRIKIIGVSAHSTSSRKASENTEDIVTEAADEADLDTLTSGMIVVGGDFNHVITSNNVIEKGWVPQRPPGPTQSSGNSLDGFLYLTRQKVTVNKCSTHLSTTLITKAENAAGNGQMTGVWTMVKIDDPEYLEGKDMSVRVSDHLPVAIQIRI